MRTSVAMSARSLLLLTLAASMAGCGRESAAPDGSTGGADASRAAPSTAEGGRCIEHGVLASVCARCNPALAAVYQAKGDWCSEHGLAESFCPICHPETGGMPRQAVHDDEPPADGTRVQLASPDTARRIGLRAEAVASGDEVAEIVVTARIVYDAAKRAEVNARLSGVVRALHADAGTRVRAGSPLAELESAGVGAERSRQQSARSRTDVTGANYERMKQLHAEGIVAEKDMLAAQQELESARADLRAAESALGAAGTDAQGAGRYTLVAPIAGVVSRRHATLGRLVDTQEVLFEIVDTSAMWAEIDIPEMDVPRVAAGDRVVVTVDGLGEREFTGTLDWVAPEIDARTRTAIGRVALRNPDGALRANMFARARVQPASRRQSVLVPRGAVQRARTAHLVFVCMQPGVYEARRVRVGASAGGWVEVTGRVAPGDSVVTEGSFLLKTETLKESIGAGCCEIGAPGQ